MHGKYWLCFRVAYTDRDAGSGEEDDGDEWSMRQSKTTADNVMIRRVICLHFRSEEDEITKGNKCRDPCYRCCWQSEDDCCVCISLQASDVLSVFQLTNGSTRLLTRTKRPKPTPGGG